MQFSLPLVWMFHSRTLNSWINKLKERASCLVYNDSSSSFSELLQKDDCFTIPHQNIQKPAIEIYKVKHHEVPKCMSELFSQVNLSYNLRKDTKFCSYNVKIEKTVKKYRDTTISRTDKVEFGTSRNQKL